MNGLRDLSREYEARRYPPARQLDVHGEGPRAARDRALRWIQSYAHEEPGQELLLIVQRGGRQGRGAVRIAVEKLLRELDGRLIEWWQEFGTGSIAVRVAEDPRMHPFAPAQTELPQGEGRTVETARDWVSPHDDIPDELRDLAGRAAELRRAREGISLGLLEVVLRRLWIEAQATAMSEGLSWEEALRRVLAEEEARALEED